MFSSHHKHRGGRSHAPHEQPAHHEAAEHSICTFYAKGNLGSGCKFGNKCKHEHGLLSVLSKFDGHTLPVKSLGLLQTENGPRILSGSMDSLVKVWNLSTGQLEHTIQNAGAVQSIQVKCDDSSPSASPTIMWATEEVQPDAFSDLPVGVVHLYNLQSSGTIPIKRSSSQPYTHPMQIRSFHVEVKDNNIYVITGGGEGTIRTWHYDVATSSFANIAVLEGHIRSVTCLLVVGSNLWSGSTDKTIRVWDINSGTSLGVLSDREAGGGCGHKEAVSALEHIVMNPESNSMVASGSCDGQLKVWRLSGESIGSFNHSAVITSMKCFQDDLGGQKCLLLGLLDGRIVVRSCVSMNILFVIDSAVCQTRGVWSIVALGQSCFATGGDDCSVVVWRVERPL